MVNNEVTQSYEPVYCEELVQRLDISEGEKQSMLKEMAIPMICPNTTEIILEGTGLFGSTFFEVTIELSDTADPSILDNTIILNSSQSRYFNAESYVENGYQSSVTLNSDVFYTRQNTAIEVM